MGSNYLHIQSLGSKNDLLITYRTKARSNTDYTP
jgi:hypothetical protein